MVLFLLYIIGVFAGIVLLRKFGFSLEGKQDGNDAIGYILDYSFTTIFAAMWPILALVTSLFLLLSAPAWLVNKFVIGSAK